jgi:hypothetical protein
MSERPYPMMLFVAALPLSCADGLPENVATLNVGMNAPLAGMTSSGGSPGGGGETTASGGTTPIVSGGLGGSEMIFPPLPSSGGVPTTAAAGSNNTGTAGNSSGGESSGGAPNEGGAGGEGPEPVLYQHARLLALSEIGGQVFASVAELNLLNQAGTPINRGAWTVSADSEEVQDEMTPAENAIDDDPQTFWHTEWNPGGEGDAPLPHQLIVDLGSPQTISGFVYLPRQEGENGRIAGYEFYLSENGSTWVTAATGTFSDSTAAQTVLFE